MVFEGFHHTEKLDDIELDIEDVELLRDWFLRFQENPFIVEDRADAYMKVGLCDIPNYELYAKPVWLRSKYEIENNIDDPSKGNNLRIRVHDDIVSQKEFGKNDFRHLDFQTLLSVGRISSFYVDINLSTDGISMGLYHYDIRGESYSTVDRIAEPVDYTEIETILNKDPKEYTRQERVIFEALSQINSITQDFYPRPELN